MNAVELVPNRRVAMIVGVTPVNAFGVADLAGRWKVSKTVAARWMESDGFPAVTTVNDPPDKPGGGTKVVDRAETLAWEESRRAAGLHIPGGRRRGPDKQPRARRSGAGEVVTGD